MTFIGNAVEGLASFGMGVDEDKLVTFAYNLGVEARNRWPVDDDGVGGIAPNVDYRLVQGIDVFFMMGIGADFERGRTRRYAHSPRVATLTEKRSSLSTRFGILRGVHHWNIWRHRRHNWRGWRFDLLGIATRLFRLLIWLDDWRRIGNW